MKQVDELIYDAIRADSDLMTAIKGNVVSTCFEVSPDEKGEASTYVPAESLDNLSVGVMIDRLEAQGHWDLELPVSRLLTKEWGSAVSMRSDYLNRASTIRLEDIAL